MNDARGMERRHFLSACGLAGAAIVGVTTRSEASQQPHPHSRRRHSSPRLRRRGGRYRIDVEIVECKRGRCAQHQLGREVRLSGRSWQDVPLAARQHERRDPRARIRRHDAVVVYRNAYQKVIDPEGVTTEFIRCPDPTDAGVVAKITRTKV